MKAAIIAGCVVLSVLSAPGAHASEYYLALCGRKLVYVLGHHGYSFSQIVDGNERELPSRLFRWDASDLYFRGHKCQLTELSNPPEIRK